MPLPAFPTVDAADAAGRLNLLQAGLDMINQGFTIIDSELRLVAWNRTFFDMLEFPDALARFGTPFEAFMRYNAERGEYGPGAVEDLVGERVRAAGRFEAHYFERVRPGGQIIAVRGEPVPGRGFVTIYTDITEQRRFERLIRDQNAELERRVRSRTEALERTQAALLHAQKMEAVGQLAGGLAHDFNNMLTVIIGNLVALQDRDGSAATADFLDPALMAARRGADLIRRLLTFARQQPLAPSPVDVVGLVDSLVLLLRRSLPENVALETDLRDDPLLALADPHQLESAVLNLALNARDAMPAGGELRLAAARRRLDAAAALELEVAPGDYACISVADTGVGMEAATLARALEPFFTTKQFGSGSGLGLSMVYGFARQSGGTMRLRSAAGRGTEVSLFLPQCDAVAAPMEEGVGPLVAAAGLRLVLLVEDDAEVRRIVRLQLTDLGCLVIEAENGAEALRLLESGTEVDVVISDVVMPGGIDGRSLAARARELRPGVAVLLMSGYARDLQPSGEMPVLLPKPFSRQELAAALAAVAP